MPGLFEEMRRCDLVINTDGRFSCRATARQAVAASADCIELRYDFAGLIIGIDMLTRYARQDGLSSMMPAAWQRQSGRGAVSGMAII